MRFNQRASPVSPRWTPNNPDPEWAGLGPCSTLLARPFIPRAMSAFSERRLVQAAIPLQLCLPRRADTPPTGDGWIHEIKHDGFRVLARRDKERVRLFTRDGYDFTARFPKIAAAVENLGVGSC
jgi:ATP-dependent DNA ligase